MFSKFSVQKPFTVIVAVIVALILGGVSLSQIKTDLFPEMDMPYLAVITTDPGSTAEKVEAEITDVLEGTLGTVSGVSSITSQSNDNYSLIFLEFEDDTDMDAALVKVSSAVNEVSSQLPSSAGTPNYMEISTDMMATMYVGVSSTELDVYELSEFVENTVVTEFARVDGVADVSVIGSAAESVEVRMNDGKIDAVNAKLAAHATEPFAEPQAQLDEAYASLATAQADLDAQYANYDQAGGRDYYPYEYANLDATQATIDEQRAALDASQADLDAQRDAVLEQATIDALVDKDTVAQILSAQNFAMPAGYIDDANDEQWLLRVGDEFADVAEMGSLVLANVEGVGDIRLIDVADITVIDNVGDSYTQVNAEDGILLSIYKSSIASTSEVSQACRAAMDDLVADYPDVDFYVVLDQGDYITLFIGSILNSLLLGALLAVVVLAIFLRDWKPTVVIAFSIPFSVLCSLIFMHFSGLSLNVLTLGGIALAIGMLVDNSIVVLENIYRLRGRGIPPARAAVQGAKQIAGAVVASTLTTICVFLPAIFTSGLVNQMLVPFALTVTYVLVASLVVALTLVPTISTYIFKRYTPRKEGWFERLQASYARSLEFFLRHKLLPLAVSLALLAVAVVGVLNMGVGLMPTMTSKTITATVNLPEGTTKEAAFALADEIMDIALEIDGVEVVGAMDGTATLSLMTSAANGAGAGDTVESFLFYLQAGDDVTTEDQIFEIVDELDKKTRKLDCEVVTSASSSEEMSAMLGSGLQITIKGPDTQVLEEVSADIMEIVAEVDGYTEISNGMEDAAGELHLVIDRVKLAEHGITVAQVYSAISQQLSTTADATTMAVNERTVDVTVVDETAPLTVNNLLAFEIAYDGGSVRLGDIARVEEGLASTTVRHLDGQRTMSVTAEVEEGENNSLLSRELQEKLDDYDLPHGVTIAFSGELDNINTMLEQMMLMALLGFVLIYLVMVAQFQSLLSPFIVILTVPLAFTGGFLGLLAMGEQLNILSIMGFLVLMGTVVNNGIVFVDYVNQLRLGGLEKRDALVAAGTTRMRPILMTALTTILSMLPLMFSEAVGGSMQRGMATVVVGGMIYATFMTLYVVPIMYDVLYRRQPHVVDLGPDNLDDDPGDAAVFLEQLAAQRAREQAERARAEAEAAAEAALAAALAAQASDQRVGGIPGSVAATQLPAYTGEAPARREGNEPPERPDPRF